MYSAGRALLPQSIYPNTIIPGLIPSVRPFAVWHLRFDAGMLTCFDRTPLGLTRPHHWLGPMGMLQIFPQIGRTIFRQAQVSDARRFMVTRLSVGSKERSAMLGPRLSSPIAILAMLAVTKSPAVKDENGSAASICLPDGSFTGPSAHISAPAGSSGNRSSWQSSRKGMWRPN